MGITYQEELFVKVIDEALPLLEEHWKEIANHKDVRPLEIDRISYSSMNNLGLLKILTVREDGKLIGYASFIVTKHLHYKSWRFANNDVYYLHSDYRRTGLALEFFNKIEEWLKGYGVKSIVLQDKTHTPHSKLFDKLGYTMTENVYEKLI